MTDHDYRPLRLSELARRVLNAAQALADATASEAGAAHVLLALAQEGRSFSSVLLREYRLDRLDAASWNGARGLDAVMERAYAQAERLGSHYTGTEHLLLAVSRDPGIAALLADYGADAEVLCQRLERHLAG